MVQGALREVLEAVYEQDFLDCSYGFRPGRGPHDAVRALKRAVDGGWVRWILEADVVSFFDSVVRRTLVEMLQIRVTDGSLLRLVGNCLHVGVLDGEQFSEPELGTAQGSVLSPLLGNVYLHYALDVRFEQEVKPRCGGPRSSCGTARNGWSVWCKTRRARLTRAIRTVYDLCVRVTARMD